MQCPTCHTAVPGEPPFCPSCGGAMPREIVDPLIGRTLVGKYKLVQLLGEGGMGCVYLGEQQMGTKLRKVAIKTLHSHLSRDEKIRERFSREVGTLAGLEHPNTVQVYDFGTSEDGLLFIVMEFVQGRAIADVLEKEGAMKAERVQHILQQICGSLAEAHAQGIIHRDLKPDNVVLTDRAGQKDFVKVLDFGIAKRRGEADKNEKKLTQQGMVLGTPPYMSPEQFTGQELDARSDIYSLGVMAYEMLTGTLPFDAKSAFEWATLHMTAQPKPIEATPNGAMLPESMRSAIMRCLAKSPDQRFASVNELIDRFSGRTQASPAEVAQKHATAAHGGPPPRQGTAGMPPPPAQSAVAAPYAAAAGAASAYGYGAPGAAPGQAQGQAPASAYAAPAASAVSNPYAPSQELRGKTQMGEPMAIPPGAFSPSPSAYTPPAPSPYGAPPGGGYGPGGPSPSYASTPAGVPAAPPNRGRGGGGNKGLIIGLLAVVAVLCGGAIAVGSGAFSGSNPVPPIPTDFGSSGGGTTTTTTATSTPTDTTPVDTNTAPPLSPTTTTPPYVPPHPTTPPPHPTTPPAPTPHPTTPPAPTPTPHPTTPPAPTPTPTAPPAPTPTPPPHQDPAVCKSARDAAARHSPIAAVLAAQCRAQGGTP